VSTTPERHARKGPLSPGLRGFSLLLGTTFATACARHDPATTSAPAAAGSASAAQPSARAPKHAPLAEEQSEIPAGAFFAGSVPGDPGRVPELEPRRYRAELGPYQIDRLPYPNDPKKPPLVGVTRSEAQKHCADRGARLCTELEWERACKGPDSDEYASGKIWDPRCASEPASCASGFEVLGLGASIREWTKSDVRTKADSASEAVVRGAFGASGDQHRCSGRRGVPAETRADDLGFRCCTGAPNGAIVPEPKLGDTFQKVRITAERLQALLAAAPETAPLAKDIKFFKEPEAAQAVIDRGPGDRKGMSFTVSPLRWNPVPGAEFVVLSARSGENTSFVVALHALGDDDYRVAASFVMKNEPGPVALAYDDFIRPRLHFSTCWGCPGETGKILFRKPERPVILQP
jgi:hypothetical protein